MVHGCTCPDICGVHWSRTMAMRKAALKKGAQKPEKKPKKKEPEPIPEFEVEV